MTLRRFIKQKGLRVSTVAQHIGVTRQALEQYGRDNYPTARTLKRVAQALTELGAPTTVVDLVAAVYGEESENTDVGGNI